MIEQTAPIFVVGVPRSGTTLLAAMLGAHSRLGCGPETHIFRYLPPDGDGGLCDPASWPDRPLEFMKTVRPFEKNVLEKYRVSEEVLRARLESADKSLRSMVSAFSEVYLERVGKRRWVEKTPSHLICVDRIRQIFEESWIIKIVRDPRDVALSMTRVPWGLRTLEQGIGLWKYSESSTAAFFAQDPRCIEVHFEELVARPRRVLARICERVGESFEIGMIDSAESGMHIVDEKKGWNKKATTAYDRKRAYAWKRALTRSEKSTCSELLKNFQFHAKYYKF